MSEFSTDLNHWSQMVVQELLHSDHTSVLYQDGTRYVNVLRQLILIRIPLQRYVLTVPMLFPEVRVVLVGSWWSIWLHPMMLKLF